jgi:peptidoglycan/xylan/chitin deacetylase (PgdA/CDA1 family)
MSGPTDEDTLGRAVLSVDFELFTQTPAYRRAAGTTGETGVGLSATEFLLDRLDAADARATFFTVSSVAESHPELVAAVADAGHEIASHTHSHALLPGLDASARREEYERSRAVLERIAGVAVSGFRAPAFDLPPDHFERLAAAGYDYDSSIVPSRSIPGWYGGEHDAHRPCPAARVRAGAPAGLAELPVSVMPGLRLPLTGAWLRFFGPRYTIAGMRLLARRRIAPVLYVHPWELVDLPPVEGVPKRVYWRTGAWMRRALARILDAPFAFVTARTAVEGAAGDAAGRIDARTTVAQADAGDDRRGE